MKKEILSKQLENANKLAEYYKGKNEILDEEFRALKKRYDDKFGTQLTAGYQQVSEILHANKQLMEIVRWHINPETAKENPKVDKFGNPIF